jgi:hypothetical protein
MKAVLFAKIAVSNLVILAIVWNVLQDDAGRTAYFQALGFTPSTAFYPFFYITSAVNGSIKIPGLLTLDWTQVLVAALIILDLSFALPYLRRGSTSQTPSSSSPVASST